MLLLLMISLLCGKKLDGAWLSERNEVRFHEILGGNSNLLDVPVFFEALSTNRFRYKKAIAQNLRTTS